jgi:hypothetical protein
MRVGKRELSQRRALVSESAPTEIHSDKRQNNRADCEHDEPRHSVRKTCDCSISFRLQEVPEKHCRRDSQDRNDDVANFVPIKTNQRADDRTWKQKPHVAHVRIVEHSCKDNVQFHIQQSTVRRLKKHRTIELTRRRESKHASPHRAS